MTILNILDHKTKSTGSAAVIIAIFVLSSRVLGFLRDRLLASKYGASLDLDIYYASFRIPDFIFSLIIVGAISSVFIPVFCSLFKKDEKIAWKFTNTVLSFNLVIIVLLSLTALIFTKKIIYLVAPGFNNETIEKTANLTRIMLLSPIFLSLSTIIGSILQIFKRFLLYSLAPILYNLGIISGIIFFTKFFGIYGLGLGVALGALLHFLIQLLPLSKTGWHFYFNFDIKTEGFIETLKLMIPRSLSLIANQINFWIITAISSFLSAGSISVFNFAYNIQYVPIALFGISFAIASFPELAQANSIEEKKEFIEKFSSVFKNIFFLSFPTGVFSYIFRAQLVRIILGTGKFSWLDTRLTAALLGVFAISIFSQSLIYLLTRAFYALKNTIIPFLINLLSIASTILLSLIFISIINGNQHTKFIAEILRIADLSNIKIVGIGLAFSLGSIINFIFLYIFLKRKIAINLFEKFKNSVIKTVLASFFTAPFTYFFLFIFSKIVNMETFWGILTQTAGSGLLTLMTFIFISKLLKSEELNKTFRFLKDYF